MTIAMTTATLLAHVRAHNARARVRAILAVIFISRRYATYVEGPGRGFCGTTRPSYIIV